MTPQETLVNLYIGMWNETDAATRRELIAETWTEGAIYVDPLMRGDGHRGICEMVGAVQERFPDHRFRLTGPVDAHNDRVRFGWELGVEGAAPLVKGVDFGVVSADGRLEAITGFLDQAPAPQ